MRENRESKNNQKQMNKKLKALVMVLAVILISVFGIMVVKANTSLLDRIAQYAGQILGKDISQKLIDSRALDLEQTFGGPTASTNWEQNNGEVVYHLSASFIDASTTIVSIVDPFLMATTSMGDVVISGTYPNGYTGASSTVEMIRLSVLGVSTSSFAVGCAAAPTAYATSSASYDILISGPVATSSRATIENNVTAALGASVNGGTVAKIMIGPSFPYLICKVWEPWAGSLGGFTGTTNTFDGTFVARISKNQ